MISTLPSLRSAQGMKPLYSTPSLSISYDTANEWLYVEWKGHHDAQSAQTGGELVLHYLQVHPCHKMLNDNSQVTSNWEEGARWVGSQYYMLLAGHGMRFVAWVCPPHWSARRSMEIAMQFVTKPVVILFDDVASGYDWLSRQT
jgi:hypothetical protein